MHAENRYPRFAAPQANARMAWASPTFGALDLKVNTSRSHSGWYQPVRASPATSGCGSSVGSNDTAKASAAVRSACVARPLTLFGW